MTTSEIVVWAQRLAHRYMAEEFAADRWLHVQAVAGRAAALSPVCGPDADLLVAAAWVHDIGYAKDLAHTGFHPLDGARFLEDLDADSRIVRLVAHHSAAFAEAQLRGLTSEYARWPMPVGVLQDALWCADMTTGQRGQTLDFDARLADILARHGATHTVSQAIGAEAAQIRRAICSTMELASRHRLDVGELTAA